MPVEEWIKFRYEKDERKTGGSSCYAASVCRDGGGAAEGYVAGV